MTAHDRVYRDARPYIADFAFDESVAAVFPDMIRRSVPGYETVIPLTGLLAARALRTAPGDALAYDLGCSLGATTLALLRELGDHPGRVIAVDNAPAMIERARTLNADPRITWVCADIRDLPLEPCRVVTLNYVLQFVPPEDRLAVLRRIRDALVPDGLLLLSEKIRFDDPDTQRDYEAAHLDYKRANGYSELEISQKRTALENVMIVDTEDTHRARLAQAGFTRVRKWYQCLNWASFEARP
ncbi:MAG TPA: carboxy-S-adenosyl-L-methionine synthase CmoA [Pseudomonadales bacterium]